MSAISGLGAGNATANNNTIASNGATSAEGLSTMFLDLLVAQISHQNPEIKDNNKNMKTQAQDTIHFI